jgi:glycosyltransferase involved in cell wall biosynthesis
MKESLGLLGIISYPCLNLYLRKVDYVWLNWFENLLINSAIYLSEKELFYKKCNMLDNLQETRKKIVWTLHNRQQHNNATQFSKKIMKKLATISYKIIIHSAMSISVLEEICDNVEGIHHKIIYIPHPNYCELYGKQKVNILLQNKILKLLFIGSVSPYKNIDILIKIINDLSYKNIELKICGLPITTEYAEYLKMLIDNSQNIIHDFRFIPDNEISSILADCHILVLPYDLSSSLNSGTTVLAFSYGRTVLSPLNGTLDNLNDKSLFFAYDYNSPIEHYIKLKDKIIYLHDKYFNSYNSLLHLGEKCHDYIIENNNLSKVSESLAKVFV